MKLKGDSDIHLFVLDYRFEQYDDDSSFFFNKEIGSFLEQKEDIWQRADGVGESCW